MLRLRPFKLCDAPYLLKWFQDEKSFMMWNVNRFTYPFTMEQIIDYKNSIDEDPNAWIFVALDENGTPVGHFFLRNADYEKQSIHLGLIVVDSTYRGKGYGKEMVSLAIQYATEILKMSRVTLSVFGNNEAAHNCYKSVGLIDEKFHPAYFEYKAEKWDLYDMVYIKE